MGGSIRMAWVKEEMQIKSEKWKYTGCTLVCSQLPYILLVTGRVLKIRQQIVFIIEINFVPENIDIVVHPKS